MWINSLIFVPQIVPITFILSETTRSWWIDIGARFLLTDWKQIIWIVSFGTYDDLISRKISLPVKYFCKKYLFKTNMSFFWS